MRDERLVAEAVMAKMDGIVRTRSTFVRPRSVMQSSDYLVGEAVRTDVNESIISNDILLSSFSKMLALRGDDHTLVTTLLPILFPDSNITPLSFLYTSTRWPSVTFVTLLSVSQVRTGTGFWLMFHVGYFPKSR